MSSSKALTPLSAAKSQLRREIAAKLSKLPEEEIARQSRSVFLALVKKPEFVAARRVSVYVNTANEIITDEIIKKCLQDGKETFIPHFIRKCPTMRMLRLKNLAEFQNLDATLWNIRQHPQNSEAEEYIETGALDLVLTPGVAFTKCGHRLGHGMGYYDRWLSDHEQRFGKQPLKIGLALNEQVIDSVPVDETDVSLDFVLHEAGIS
ncbi:unnamed protein product, partial [Mesorhabditis spiculigera]